MRTFEEKRVDELQNENEALKAGVAMLRQTLTQVVIQPRSDPTGVNLFTFGCLICYRTGAEDAIEHDKSCALAATEADVREWLEEP